MVAAGGEIADYLPFAQRHYFPGGQGEVFPLKYFFRCGSAGPGALRAYTPPYGGAGYLSEGRFLSLTNLVFLVPSVSATPTPNTEVLVEYGVARRFDRNDFAYAGGLSPYEGTEALRSPDIGRLLRAEGAWAPRSWLTLFVAMERFTPGKLLRDVNLTSGFYANMGATFRY